MYLKELHFTLKPAIDLFFGIAGRAKYLPIFNFCFASFLYHPEALEKILDLLG